MQIYVFFVICREISRTLSTNLLIKTTVFSIRFLKNAKVTSIQIFTSKIVHIHHTIKMKYIYTFFGGFVIRLLSQKNIMFELFFSC